MHILSVEYPGYGIYNGKPNAEQILDDARTVLKFLINDAKILPENLIIYGRSIGAGPACSMAVEFNPGMLVLISAYRCLKDVVKDLAAKYKLGWLAGVLFADRFRNIDIMPLLKCPTFFLHGQNDDLIPLQHSQDLISKCVCKSVLHIPFEMDHNTFDYKTDFAVPFLKFSSQVNLKFEPDKEKCINFKKEYYEIPNLESK